MSEPHTHERWARWFPCKRTVQREVRDVERALLPATVEREARWKIERRSFEQNLDLALRIAGDDGSGITILELRGIDTYQEFIERHRRAMGSAG